MKMIRNFFKYFFIGVNYLASKKIVVIFVMCLFVSLLKVTTAYREEVIMYEEDMIYEKGNPNIAYYNEEVEKFDFDDNMAVDDLVACYKKGIDLDKVPSNIKSYVDELNNLYNEDERYFSFLYQDLYSGFTVSYNEDAPIFTASTIKAPAMIYLYEMASMGKVNLDEELVYTSNFYRGGSGIIQNEAINSKHLVKDLIDYSIYYSDNIAYSMLMDRYKRENILDFWNKLGTKHIYTNNTIWGITSARDASIYMKELYRFSLEDKKYGSELMNYFKMADWKLIVDKNKEFNTASKGGWSNQSIHDVAIVFDRNPYILVIMSNMGEDNYSYLFNKTSELTSLLHSEYWKYKVNSCGDISLY